MNYDFSPNPNAPFQTFELGKERQPVLVVDDCLLHPQSVVDYAATTAKWEPPKQMYPGIVAPAPRQYPMAILRLLAGKLREIFDVQVEQAQINCFFAIATTPPQELNVGQRLPHIDTPNPRQIALLHYLCDASHGGTAFYRHRATGYEACDEQQYLQVVQQLQQDEAANGPLPAQYVTGSNRLYEQTANVDAKFNRLLIYRSRVLHSANISPACNFSSDPRIGRLTANTFLAFQ